tara:strand:+ start:739 stop:1776 length:1038 start_codon:yes stop_codon:yes gene_type:complete
VKFGNLIIHKNKPTIIAEIGVNHGCNLSLAKKYINLVKKSRVDAAKFQTYKAENIASPQSPAYWDLKEEKTKSQFLLFKKFDKFNFKDYKILFEKCKKKKIVFMTTLFDTMSVDKYNKLIGVFKISSSDITNVPLIKKIGSKKKPVILSTGSSKLSEIKFAIKTLKLSKKKICLMHCVLNYPTKNASANLEYIKTLKKKFPGILIGYSDHTRADKNLTSVLTAYNLGAQIIEKHFTHNPKLRGNDHYHAATYKNFINFYEYLNKINTLRGKRTKNLNIETKSIKYARRSIFLSKDIIKGEKLSEKNLITLRPGTGISASKWDFYIGKRFKKNLRAGTMLKIGDIT